MEIDKILVQAKRILQEVDKVNTLGEGGILSEASEFLKIYAGERSSFYKNLMALKASRVASESYHNTITIKTNIEAFVRFVENGLYQGTSIERQAQIDVVSDILSQAQNLLEMDGVHPAAPAMVIGACLEEFLRNWVENDGLPIGNSKPSIDAYAKALREAELISKQDIKDITSWAGIRNHAAHGEWEEVSNKNRISLMLEGVNLFMRKYSSEEKR